VLILTWHVSAEVPTDEERKAILECHTKLRENVNPPASNMMLMMVWAASTQFGCALKNCPSRNDVSKSMYTLVCIYKPSDRLVAARPYERGKSCSQCLDGYGCLRNQCSKDAPTNALNAMTTTSIGTVIFAMLLLHCF
uniref:SCP domain-containing protein n=1 Tax=Mesocestoides corti TaxID=53468 RepID=A0A5K3FT70_MESCO